MLCNPHASAPAFCTETSSSELEVLLACRLDALQSLEVRFQSFNKGAALLQRKLSSFVLQAFTRHTAKAQILRAMLFSLCLLNPEGGFNSQMHDLSVTTIFRLSSSCAPLLSH